MLALITVTRDSEATLRECLASTTDIRSEVKHVFVDGSSSDGTLGLLSNFLESHDNALLYRQEGLGLYQAINQGVGEALADNAVRYVGLLHSDDKLIKHGFSAYLSAIERGDADVYYSDIRYHNSAGKVVRVWRAGTYSPLKLRLGWMPPHTSVIVSRRVFEEVGLYNPDFGTAADYDWIVRILRSKRYRVQYFPTETVSMRTGGASGISIAVRLRANAMDGAVWASESRLQGLLIRVMKPMRKVSQFLAAKLR